MTSAAWQFARACFDFADFATNDTQRADIARLGIAACRKLLARDTNSAPGHYYLAMNYGQLARAEAPSLAAYRLVRQMEREFKTAADLDKHFDYAGPERCLGLLYRDAPGWPFSIGSRRKAREWLEQAAKLAPDYPENQLNLAETFLQWHESDNAKQQIEQHSTRFGRPRKRISPARPGNKAGTTGPRAAMPRARNWRKYPRRPKSPGTAADDRN